MGANMMGSFVSDVFFLAYKLCFHKCFEKSSCFICARCFKVFITIFVFMGFVFIVANCTLL